MTELSGAMAVAGGGASRPLPAAVPAVAVAGAPTPASAQIAQAMQQIGQHLQAQGRSITFQVDQQTHMTIVRIYNEATGELVRQIPAEEVVHIAQMLSQSADGGVDLKA